MVRLTASLVTHAPQVVNALKERELVLRGRNLQHLEAGAGDSEVPAMAGGAAAAAANTDSGVAGGDSSIDLLWGVAQAFDCVDFSDNALQRLDGFNFAQAERFAAAANTPFDFTGTAQATPVTKKAIRLSTIIAHNNRIARISAATVRSLAPTLHTFAAHNNAFSQLSDLAVFGGFTNLERLFLKGNAVCNEAQYRLYAIAVCPKLKLLDGERVKDTERAEAVAAFPEAAAAGKKDRRSRRERRRQEQADKRDREPGFADADAVQAAPAAAVDKEALMAELAAKMEAATTVEEMEAIEAQLAAIA